MSLFKRKAADDDVPKCPACGERVPEGAARCAMCGHAFETDRDEVAANAPRRGT
jgi:DNA-directed RNA polymerase subunit RPC12/RpoP